MKKGVTNYLITPHVLPAGIEPAQELPTITFTKQSAGATGIVASTYFAMAG